MGLSPPWVFPSGVSVGETIGGATPGTLLEIDGGGLLRSGPPIADTPNGSSVSAGYNGLLWTGSAWVEAKLAQLDANGNPALTGVGDSVLVGTDNTGKIVAGPGTAHVNHATGTVLYALDYAKGDGVTDDTAALSTALNAAVTAGAICDLGSNNYLVDGEIQITATPTAGGTPQLRIRSTGATLIDANATGPILRFYTAAGAGSLSIDDLTIDMTVDKQAYNVLEFVNLGTAHFDIHRLRFTGGKLCKSAVYLQDLWEGEFRNCNFFDVLGHPIDYQCPTLNGGNVHLDSCQFSFCLGGNLYGGANTNNSIIHTNCKFVCPRPTASYQLFEDLTTSLPNIGATTLTLPTGINAQYFRANQAVVLVSGAGIEVVHMAASTPYNNGTGVLSLFDTVTLNHSAQPDMRILTASNWAFIALAFTPSLTFIGGHFEGSPAVISSAEGALLETSLVNPSFTANAGAAYQFFITGASCSVVLRDTFLEQPSWGTTGNTSFDLVYGIFPTTAPGSPTIDVDRVSTFPGNLADQASSEWGLLTGNSNFLTSGSYSTRSDAKGVQNMTQPGQGSWATNRPETANYTTVAGDEVILANATAGAITITLGAFANKRVIVKKTDSSANAVTVAPAGGHTIDGAANYSLTAQYQFVEILYNGSTYYVIGAGTA
jgi:hypothetical protein